MDDGRKYRRDALEWMIGGVWERCHGWIDGQWKDEWEGFYERIYRRDIMECYG